MGFYIFVCLFGISISSVSANGKMIEKIDFYSNNHPTPPENVCEGTNDNFFFASNPRGESDFFQCMLNLFFLNLEVLFSFRLCLVFFM